MIVAALVLAASLDGPASQDVQEFVEKDTTILAVERGDLNRDGRADAVVVLEPSDPEAPRPLLILVRGADGRLRLAKRSAKTVACRTCGGVMGDPFQGVYIERSRFTVDHYGGSSWRWTASYTFAWSSRDQSWQLVRAEHTSFHAGDPDEVETEIHTPPKDFGLIDVTEFDPEDYLGRGKK